MQANNDLIKYRIEWKCSKSGVSGHGDWFDAQFKKKLLIEVANCNQEYPHIYHQLACNQLPSFIKNP